MEKKAKGMWRYVMYGVDMKNDIAFLFRQKKTTPLKKISSDSEIYIGQRELYCNNNMLIISFRALADGVSS